MVLLDTRQHRSDQPCDAPGALGGRLVPAADCTKRTAEERTMLGEEQERWALRHLGGAQAA